MGRRPAQRLPCQRHIGHQDRRIARPPRRLDGADLAAREHARPRDQLADGGALSGAEIVGLEVPALQRDSAATWASARSVTCT